MKKKENPKSKPYTSFKDFQWDIFEELDIENEKKERELVKQEEDMFLRKKEEIKE